MDKIRLGLSVIVFFCASLASGQVTNDFGVWIAGSFETDLTRSIDLSIEQEFRLKENATELGKSYTTVSLDFKLEKWLSLGANYRFILNKGSDGVFGHRHRVMGDVVLKMDKNRFTFANRVRLQSEIRTVNYTSENGFSPATDFRNTIKVNYRLNRKYKTYASLDLRFLMRDARTPYFQGFDRHRITAGLEIKLSRNKSIDMYVRTSRHWNVKEPTQLFIVGMDFTFGGNGLLFGS